MRHNDEDPSITLISAEVCLCGISIVVGKSTWDSKINCLLFGKEVL
jgi:hypothetical protein